MAASTRPAAASVRVLVRPAAASVRLRVVLRPRRRGSSSTCVPRGLDRAAGDGTGLGSRAAGRCCGGRKILRMRVPSVDLQPCEGSTGGRSTAGGARCGNDASFSWTVPGEVRISRPPNANGTRDASFTRARPNASAFTTGSRRQRRTFGTPTFERRTLRPPQHPPTARDQRIRRPPGRGPFGDRPQRRPRQRSSSPRPPAAAQQHDETPAAAHLQPKTPYARGARGDRR